MKYILIKTKKKKIVKNIEEAQNSFTIKRPKLKAKSICINNQVLIDQIVLIAINSKLDNLFKRIFNYLTEDEDNEEQTGLLYDELAKERSIILKEYEDILSKEAILEYMKKIRIAAYELKKRLMSYNYKMTNQKGR